MSAPTTLAVADTFNAVKMYGRAEGTWSFQSTSFGLAAYERIISSAVGSGERRPRKVLMATGKKVR